MQLAEMLQGKSSVQMYRKGITVLENDAAKYEIAQKQQDKMSTVRQMSSAWASVADIYMTDLW